MSNKEGSLNKLAKIADKADAEGHTKLASILDSAIVSLAQPNQAKLYEHGLKEAFDFAHRLMEEAGDNLSKLRTVRDSLKHLSDTVVIPTQQTKDPEQLKNEMSEVERLLAFDL